jgi:hypothetical protein
LRSGDVILDGETRARSFALATDTGSITVIGTIDASGAAGGTIRLSAKQDLTVADGAVIRANANDAKKSSGLIELVAAEGNMDLQAGATIETIGGRNGNGDIHLRFKRDDANGRIKLVNASATMTAAKIVAEAYRAYDTTSVDATLPGALADAAGFMSTYAAAIEASLGRSNDATFHLVPGVELASTGDLALSNDVDLHEARYGGEAGVLTLRAAGNLVLNGSLSDGFDSAASTAAVGTDLASWSYRLAGGADLDAANPLAVRPFAMFGGGASGNVGLGSGSIVRTGTGSISVAAGNDVVLADKSSVIYTAGAKIADPTLGGTFEELIDYTAELNPDGSYKTRMPDFTHHGGDIRVTAQNDVKTLVASDQMIVDWLWREGYSNTTGLGETGTKDGTFFKNQQTAWWINYATFQQGIAALGGGSVTVDAGRDIVNVSASTPTQGRVGGGRTGTTEAKTVAITGGGDLTVRAGRDIVGGVYYVDHGTGALTAGGAITSNRTAIFEDADAGTPNPRSVPIRTVLALGDAELKLTAGGNIDLATASNPTQWMRSKAQVPSTQPPYPIFSTYGANTELTLLSTGGDVTLWNTPVHLIAATPAWSHFYAGNSSSRDEAATTLVYYPGKITAIAAAGDINVPGGMVMYPSATGNLDLWAQHSVNLTLTDAGGGWIDGAVFRTLVMSPTDPAFMPSILRPRPRENMQVPLTVVHASDSEPSRIYANEGDITEGRAGGSNVGGRGHYYAEQVRFRAGRDINNIRVRAQNSNFSDLSLFQAGRDLNLGDGRISIDGPGFVLAEAGRDVFLGRGAGIETTGNGETGNGPGQPSTYTNPALPRQGADLLVLAGTADDPRYDAFATAYLDPANVAAMPSYLVASGKPIYLSNLVAFMRQVTGDVTLSEDAAFTAFQDPRYVEYRKFLIDRVLSRELRAAGRGQLDGLGDEGLGYERGYAAIATLFPGAEQRGNTGWQGDIIMDKSMIRTYLGGDVDILAPGGIVQVSALSSNGTGDRDGILTINGGEIRITTGLGTIINKSRVLTARGGDITIWSTFGDIDAGKGRKSALSNPASSYQLSLDGTISYETSPSFSGSGISTQKGAPDAPESDVDLYAPSGTINAGDAGIQVSGNVYLGAPTILGADNISAGGDVKGLPPAEGGTAALTIESDAGSSAAADAAKDATQSGPSGQPSIIIVEVLGFGGGDETPRDDERRDKTDGKQSYNPAGPVKVVGYGPLSEADTQNLTEEEKRKLLER